MPCHFKNNTDNVYKKIYQGFFMKKVHILVIIYVTYINYNLDKLLRIYNLNIPNSQNYRIFYPWFIY
jgi:hypothetical protein